MPTFPVRNLGAAGIVADINAYDLPPNVLSSGVNIRFDSGRVSRAPVFREVFDLTAEDAAFTPGYLFPVPPAAAGDPESIVTVSRDYSTFYQIIGSTASDVTPPSGLVTGDNVFPFTHAFLGGVSYVNRYSSVPFSKTALDATFVALPNWDAAWTCGVLRPYKDFLVALNVTKSSVEYPQMVKWSDITQFGDVPPSWDHTLTTNSAGENVLNQMQGRIVDGCVLRDTFMIYAENEVWAMNYIGGDFIFDIRKTFDDVGAINTNCVVEVDGRHYVFDRTDIIVHDGSSKDSIIHGKDRDFVFQALDYDQAHLCFVSHNPKLSEIHFCYASNDSLTGFLPSTEGCNRAAVFNYRNGTWTFYDLPNVTFGCNSVVTSALTYDSSDPYTYEGMGGSYADGSSDKERHHLFASAINTGDGITASRIVGFDLVTGGRLARPVVTELLKDAYAERTGIDLDETGAALASYKSIQKVYPQANFEEGTLTFQYGASDLYAVEPSWSAEQSFVPTSNYQVDVRSAGRYLAHRFRYSGYGDFNYSGFDVLMTIRGRR